MATKLCRQRNTRKNLDEFSPHPRCLLGVYPDCRECRAVKARERYRLHKEKLLAAQRERRAQQPETERNRYRKRKYGFDVAAERMMSEQQGGRCAICGKKTQLVIDHCHVCTEVRALLCTNCNLGLGHFGDNPLLLGRAASYLRKWKDCSTALIDREKTGGEGGI